MALKTFNRNELVDLARKVNSHRINGDTGLHAMTEILNSVLEEIVSIPSWISVTKTLVSDLFDCTQSVSEKKAQRIGDTIISMKETLSGSRYDLVEVNCSYETKKQGGKTYCMITEFKVMNLHQCVQPKGWIPYGN